MIELTSQHREGFKAFAVEGRLDDSRSGTYYVVRTGCGRRFRVSASALVALDILRAGGTLAAAAEATGVRPELMPQLELQLKPLLDVATELSPSSPRSGKGLWLRRPLLRAQSVIVVASPFVRLYRLIPAAAAVIVIAASFLYAWRSPATFSLGGSGLFLAYTLFFASLMVHEIGHSAACLAFGASPSEIGFAVYLFYPSLYSDVGACWALPRWRRVLVDIGGFYFQFLFGAVLLAVYASTGCVACRVAFDFIVYTAIISVNPIFRFDGYWALADCLGVSNLGKEASRTAKYLWRRLFHGPSDAIGWPPWVAAALIVYAAAGAVVWTQFALYLAPMCRAQIEQVVHGGMALLASLRAGHLAFPAVVGLVMSVVFSVLTIGLIAQFVIWVGRWVHNLRRSTVAQGRA